jgi:hypothetical protein
MNAKLLKDETLREDLYIEMMFTAGSLAIYGIPVNVSRNIIDEQINLLMPVVKRYMKRSVRAYKDTTPT